MKYIYEIVQDGAPVSRGTVDASHPHQILRHIAESSRSLYVDVYLVNERGGYWNFLLKRKNGVYKKVPVAKAELSDEQIGKAFVGNKRLSHMG